MIHGQNGVKNITFNPIRDGIIYPSDEKCDRTHQSWMIIQRLFKSRRQLLNYLSVIIRKFLDSIMPISIKVDAFPSDWTTQIEIFHRDKRTIH